MDYKVLISPRARGNLKALVQFIAHDNPHAAMQLGQLLIEKALSLRIHSLRGLIVPEINEPGVRELIFKSYRIIYQVSEPQRTVDILRFWHAARGTPEIH